MMQCLYRSQGECVRPVPEWRVRLSTAHPQQVRAGGGASSASNDKKCGAHAAMLVWEESD